MPVEKDYEEDGRFHFIAAVRNEMKSISFRNLFFAKKTNELKWESSFTQARAPVGNGGRDGGLDGGRDGGLNGGRDGGLNNENGGRDGGFNTGIEGRDGGLYTGETVLHMAIVQNRPSRSYPFPPPPGSHLPPMDE